MNRTLRIALLAILALAIAAPLALATRTKITGGTTTLAPSAGAVQVLTDNHITATAIAPATANTDGSYSFPITRGHVNAKLRGKVFHKGGLSLSNGTRTVNFRRVEIVSTRHGALLRARVHGLKCHRLAVHRGRHARHHIRARCRRAREYRVAVAVLTNGKRISATTVSADARITRFTARVVNRLAGKVVVHAGGLLGTVTVSATVAAPAA